MVGGRKGTICFLMIVAIINKTEPVKCSELKQEESAEWPLGHIWPAAFFVYNP